MYISVKAVRSSGTVVRDSCTCWELNHGPQEEQSVYLTTGPCLQPLPGRINNEALDPLVKDLTAFTQYFPFLPFFKKSM